MIVRSKGPTMDCL